MTDYTKLIEALRCKVGLTEEETKCEKCPYGTDYSDCDAERYCADGATAIEELTAQVRDKDYLIQQQADEIEHLRADVKRQQEKMIKLAKKLPKLGEWQKAKPKGVVTYSDGYAECSHCHETIWLGWWMNFCPHCGTQNKIIDPDDYDGAKMEVQE